MYESPVGFWSLPLNWRSVMVCCRQRSSTFGLYLSCSSESQTGHPNYLRHWCEIEMFLLRKFCWIIKGLFYLFWGRLAYRWTISQSSCLGMLNFSRKRRIRKRSDPVLWQNPYTNRKFKTTKWQHKNAIKNLIT